MSSADPNQPDATEGHPGPAPTTEPTVAKEVEQHFGPAQQLRSMEKDIEREIEAAMGGLTDKELYGEPQQKRGKKSDAAAQQGPKKGRVVAVHGGDVFVNVPGGRSQGVLPLSQFEEGPPAVGCEIDVYIERYDESNGLLLLTRKGAAVQADWSSVSPGMIVEARVTGTNKGGLSVDINGIRGFMPISQIDLYRVENVEQFVNQKLKCLVTEVDPQERNLVVSRRALLEKEREEQRDRLWQELAEGQVRTGVVRSVREFGAFIDLGGVDALLHVSEMSWSRVQHPDQILQPGQSVQVIVLKVDRERRKVGVGMKQLSASPWDAAVGHYSVNSVVKGKVTRVTDFGAFVELEPGVEGLVHISELSPQRVRRVTDVVQPGQEVDVLVLRVDSAQRKIALSLKGAAKAPETPKEEETAEEPASKPARTRGTPLRGGLGDH